MAVLELQDQQSADYLARNEALSTGADPLDVLRGMAATLIERDQRVGLVELSAVLTGEATAPAHPAHDYFETRYRNIRSFMTRLFTRLRDEGRLSTDLPAAHLAAITIAAMDGLHTQWLFDRSAINVDACVTSLMSTFVPELKPDAQD